MACPRGTKTRVLVMMAVATCIWGLVACKSKKILETSTTAYILGINDIKPLTPDRKNNQLEQAILAEVLLATRLESKKTKFCSGTLVDGENPEAPLRILTNHHCFAEVDEEGKALASLLKEACTNTKVYFGFEVGSSSEHFFESSCAPGSLRTDYNGDLGVFQLTVPPPEKHKPLKFYAGTDLGKDRRAFIIHHPDVESTSKVPPNGSVKLPTASITIDDCRVIGPFDGSEWDLDRTLPFSIRHTCDLIHGSSGSALIDAETSTILGVNWGGIKISQGGDLRTENVATRSDYAEAFLSNTLESFLKSTPALKSIQVGAEEGSESQPAPKSKSRKSFVSGLTGRKCGVVGYGSSLPDDVQAFLMLLATFIFPGLIALRTFRRSPLR